jgi:DtxR family Mn-dependent transcriptional regulator
MPTSTLEEYIEAIYKLAQRGTVRPTQLAEAMAVSAPTVTNTLKRLETRELITRPGGAISLTPLGQAEALSILRRHRLAEIWLKDVLDLPWDAVHEEACRLEHAMSPRVVDALEAYLNDPERCPHGHPIPRADGSIAALGGRPLPAVGAGRWCVVAIAEEEQRGILARADEIGLRPGVVIEVTRVAGGWRIDTGSGDVAVEDETAARIIVEEVR